MEAQSFQLAKTLSRFERCRRQMCVSAFGLKRTGSIVHFLGEKKMLAGNGL
jgi:hypothetical protein